VTVPESWPPEYFDAPALHYTLARLEEGPAQAGWWLHYLVRREDAVLVGVAGYTGPQVEGVVEIGYSIVPEHRRRGYATEAAAALVAHAFSFEAVDAVIAETLPELVPSIGVLEKLGFALVGEGAEAGVIRYRRERTA
jgi:RimJ/RimL family protein N-acetyltransferase